MPATRAKVTDQAFTDEELRIAEQMQSQNLPLWREALLGVDWLALRFSPVFQGVGIPHGDGSGVLLVPGFMGSDRYLGDMRSWLGKIAYAPYLSGIGRNIECPNILSQRLHQTMLRAYDDTGERVHLIGHSLGGVIARSAAARWPEITASVITLASPFRGVRAHPFVLMAASLVRGTLAARRAATTEDKTQPECFTGKCSCEFVEALKTRIPPQVLETAIYTKTDGVVDWERCMTEDPRVDIEVKGTHVGLAFNPTVYGHLAQRLAMAVVQH
jgi:pimeloyl-ACP methyl ester carboxylesterase